MGARALRRGAGLGIDYQSKRRTVTAAAVTATSVQALCEPQSDVS